MGDKIEFYQNDVLKAVVRTSMIPTVGSLISIKKLAHKIINVSFSLDYADQPDSVMRCNVDIEPLKEKKD